MKNSKVGHLDLLVVLQFSVHHHHHATDYKYMHCYVGDLMLMVVSVSISPMAQVSPLDSVQRNFAYLIQFKSIVASQHADVG